jgi:hypothetical protein
MISINSINNPNAKLVNNIYDYVHRSEFLEEVITYYEYMANYCKITIKRSKLQSNNDNYNYESENSFPNTVNNEQQNSNKTKSSTKPRFVRAELGLDHSQYGKYELYRYPAPKFPILYGPSIPRQNDMEQRLKYAKIILPLFKPWRTTKDLIKVNDNWIDSLNFYELMKTTIKFFNL